MESRYLEGNTVEQDHRGRGGHRTPTLLLTECGSGGSTTPRAQSTASASAEVVATGAPQRPDADLAIRAAILKADTVRTLADDVAEG